MTDLLFSDNDLYDFLRGEMERAKGTVDTIPEDQFLHSSDDDIFEHVFSQLQVDHIELREDLMEMDTNEVQVHVSADIDRFYSEHVPGLKITVTVPFTGNPLLWRCQPSTFTSLRPHANILTYGRGEHNGYLKIVIERPSDTLGDAQEIKNSIDGSLKNINNYLGYVRNDVEKHNQDLERIIRQSIEARRKRLETHGKVIEAINIPLKKDATAPDISKLPIRKKMIKPLPAPPKTPPEPGISDEDYEYILNIIRHEGRSFETTPKTFAVHDEDELRDIILAHLNTHFKGQASGETFRKSGKTDIRIEDQNRAAFVAECKVWRGKAELSKALDQLLGYLIWRDCKAALIVFNTKNAKFSDIQAKLPGIIAEHTNMIRHVESNEHGEWRYIFKAGDDEERQVTIHVFLFNIYAKQDGN
ncbi:MAG TPA: hypothetical protein ENH85_04925 [Candidatus Scalindua sp.]|nr:hypothetical protein [Candidatus Scalindua sp.]